MRPNHRSSGVDSHGSVGVTPALADRRYRDGRHAIVVCRCTDSAQHRCGPSCDVSRVPFAGGIHRQWERVRQARADLRAARSRAEQLISMSQVIGADLHACRTEIASVSARVDELAARTSADHARALHALRIVRDHDAVARERLWTLRASSDYEPAFDEDEPLVTILITTYSNWRLLRERALPSVLGQTYENFECIVVGDAAPQEAAAAVGSFDDPRLRFVNLPYRGPYPPDPEDAHMISGTTPWNTGLALAAGRWIGSVSDDDALSPRYVETLLALARAERAEVAYGQIRHCIPDSPEEILGAFPPQWGNWGTQCALLHAGLRYIPLEPSDWVFVIPNDMSLLERMLRIGVRFAMREEVVVDYYPSKLWKDRR